MKPRFPLSTKIFLLAFCNLVLLGLLFLGFARYGLHFHFNSLLAAPAEDRVLSLARQLALDLTDTPVESRNNLLQRYFPNLRCRVLSLRKKRGSVSRAGGGHS